MDELRPCIAEILTTIAKDGLPGPRDLDVALDAIFCRFRDGPIAEIEARAEKAEAALVFYRDEWFQNADGDTTEFHLTRTWMEPTDALINDAGNSMVSLARA